MRSRNVGRALLAALTLSLFGCSSTVPAQPHPERAKTCKVRNGATREAVQAACGMPCGSGILHEGTCAEGTAVFSSCANSCDVFATSAVCYAGDKVVKVIKLSGRGMPHVPTCSW